MTDETTVVRVGGPGELLQAVPYLLGYRPAESVVLVGLRNPRQRVGMCAAVPLPPPRQQRAALRPAVGALARSGAAGVLVVVYPRRRPSGAGLSGRSAVRVVRDLLRGTGMALEDALCVSGGRWWSYLCEDPACCPPEGNLVPGEERPAPVVAALVASGAVASASRAELVARLDPVGEPEAGAVRAALARAARAAEPAPGRGTTLLALTRRLLAARSRPGADLGWSADDVARLLIGMHDLAIRDGALCLLSDADEAPALDLLVGLVRRAPREHTAPVAAVLAWVAYARGNGALANIAIERALGADPDHSLARLLGDALSGGLHPRWLRLAVEDMRAEVLNRVG